jgi:hypothetical protein
MVHGNQTFPARRTVFHGDALAWLASRTAAPDMSVITSLPDFSEVPQLGFAGWKTWFSETAGRILSWIPDQGCAIFFQSDIRHEHTWIDKSCLIQEAAGRFGTPLIWHKIVCRYEPGSIHPGRPAYSHMLCFVNGAAWSPVRPGPDVIQDQGHKPWPRAMGTSACDVACRFLRDETKTKVVVDPFCGLGTVLAVANRWGLESVGVELSRQRSRRAGNLTL